MISSLVGGTCWIESFSGKSLCFKLLDFNSRAIQILCSIDSRLQTLLIIICVPRYQLMVLSLCSPLLSLVDLLQLSEFSVIGVRR